jgi:hypothetical protein
VARVDVEDGVAPWVASFQRRPHAKHRIVCERVCGGGVSVGAQQRLLHAEQRRHLLRRDAVRSAVTTVVAATAGTSKDSCTGSRHDAADTTRLVEASRR